MIDTRIENHIPELFQKLEAAVSRFITASAGDMGEKARSLMRAAPRPSLPGGPPAVRSGRYLGSIEAINKSSLEARVGASVPYAPVLEYGLDRPLWGRTLVETLPTLDARLAAEISAL
jgi:hypothetical protein